MAIKPGYKQTEIGVIPIDWNVMAMGSVGSIAVGKDLQEEHFSTSQDHKYKYPVYSNTVDNFGLYGFYDLVEYSGESVTIVGRGVGLGRTFARTGGFGAIGRLIVFFPDSSANHQFIAEYFNNRVTIFNESGGIPQLTGLSLAKYRIPIPPLAEQQAIARVLTDINDLISKLERLIGKKRDIKLAAMQQLLTGKTRLNGFNQGKGLISTEYGEIPSDWTLTAVSKAFELLSTASYSRSQLSDNGDGYCVHYGDIHTSWDYYLDFALHEVPQVNNDQLNYPFLKNGDLIMADASEDYSGVGKSVEVKNLGSKKAISGLHTFLMRDKGYFANGFRGYIHSIPIVKRQYDRLATGLKVYGLSKNNLRTVVIPTPPKNEQAAIVDKLQSMESEIKINISKVEKLKLVKQGMMQELLTGRIRLV